MAARDPLGPLPPGRLEAAPPTPDPARVADVCGLYTAVLDLRIPDRAPPLVAYDSASMATPGFAIGAWVSVFDWHLRA